MRRKKKSFSQPKHGVMYEEPSFTTVESSSSTESSIASFLMFAKKKRRLEDGDSCVMTYPLRKKEKKRLEEELRNAEQKAYKSELDMWKAMALTPNNAALIELAKNTFAQDTHAKLQIMKQLESLMKDVTTSEFPLLIMLFLLMHYYLDVFFLIFLHQAPNAL